MKNTTLYIIGKKTGTEENWERHETQYELTGLEILIIGNTKFSVQRLLDIANAELEGTLEILPFKSDGLCCVTEGHTRIYSGDPRNEVSASAKIVAFHVDPEESDRYDKETDKLLIERGRL